MNNHDDAHKQSTPIARGDTLFLISSHLDPFRAGSFPMFENSSNFRIHGGTFVDASRGRTGIHLTQFLSSHVSPPVCSPGIDRLFDYAIAGAAYDSYALESKASCLEGTRTQYIGDITAWATSLNDLTRHYRLLWMHGPAGVGKSAVAKSCARKTDTSRKLGATFFFSRDNSIDDPARFFTTIAYQLATEIPKYKRIVGDKIESNFGVLEKGLEAQFRELIVAPFLELSDQDDSLSQKVVFIDGLDECNGDFAQSKIIELITTSITTYGNRIPLLWAFFSRPERHINDAFVRFARFPQFWKMELPVSRDYDADIRLYFRDSLRPSSTLFDDAVRSPLAMVSWPSEEDLDALVKMVAGFFIYAATVVRFILDPNALSPQRQLKDVLAFFSQQQSTATTASCTQSSVTTELDAFYSLIMRRIPPAMLPIVQQILLAFRTMDNVPKRVPANILGLSLQELDNSLSRLHSVLTFRPQGGGESYWSFWEEDIWVGSARILFYHASFMDFLFDQQRSKEFWIGNPCHYTPLALKGLMLSQKLYEMNGLSRREKWQRLGKILSVFPADEDFTPYAPLYFRNELFYDYLTGYVYKWCECSENSAELLNTIQSFSTLVNPCYLFTIDTRFGGKPVCECRLTSCITYNFSHVVCGAQLSEATSRYLDFQKRLRERWQPPSPPSLPFLESVILEASSQVNPPSWKGAWISIASALSSSSVLQDEEVKKLHKSLGKQTSAWSNFELLQATGVLPRSIPKSGLSRWHEVFVFIEGDEHRLTNATSDLLKKIHNDDLVPAGVPLTNISVNHFWSILWAISHSYDHMVIHDNHSSARLLHFRTHLHQAADTYFRTNQTQTFNRSDAPLYKLTHMTQSIIGEYHYHEFFCAGHIGAWSQEVIGACEETLIEAYQPEEFSATLEEILNKPSADSGIYLLCMLQLDYYGFRVAPYLHQALEGYSRSNFLSCIVQSDEYGVLSSDHSGVSASTLVNIKMEQRTKARLLASGDALDKLYSILDRVWEEFLADHPMWRDAVEDHLAEQEGEVFKKLFDMPNDFGSAVQPQSSNFLEEEGARTPTSQSDSGSAQQPPYSTPIHDIQIAPSDTSLPFTSEGVPDGDRNLSASGTMVFAEHASSTQGQHTVTEERSMRKRDKIAHFFRRSFKRRRA
ncbi:hypothetical protein NP233_g12663 [Leucocoprinus birnbaumii]|uniref:Nephrocystin 3-like N-terminal domain-containing protein n=1 Tax=Leucocoprinus birnbaumii TaxID=56174 RepID=A0AAD5VE08_9AGAR|nr:hypothetical protein NP233_g12663 [Leucocoprinus birnbaumii]